MNWFEELVGFPEQPLGDVRENLVVEGEYLTSKVNKRRYRFGCLETPSLAQLREQTARHSGDKLTVRQIVSDARLLHLKPEAFGATIQVVSQFNLLEMISPMVTLEMDISRYDCNHLQGPACALACGAGTIYRNYFVPCSGCIGQSETNQIDTILELSEALGNNDGSVWTMQNGYALGHRKGVEEAGNKIDNMSEEERNELRGKLQIGLQIGTEVTIGRSIVVTQAFCSAFLIIYSGIQKDVWESLASLVLEATYESVLRAAVVNWDMGGSNVVFLTFVGVVLEENDMAWIIGAIKRAFKAMSDSGLDVRIVCHRPKPAVERLLR